MTASYRLVAIAAIFVTCLITANIIAVKVISLGPFILPAAIIVFPLSYIFGDILTEVYGYRLARKVIWLGFGCNLLFVIIAWVGQILPPAPFWEGQEAYKSILGYTLRLLAASFCGYLVGEFANSFVLAKMKILTRGRWLWSRAIGSTIVGQGLDTAVFITLAFVGTSSFVPIMILHHWLVKTVIEAIATPFTYMFVSYLVTIILLTTNLLPAVNDIYQVLVLMSVLLTFVPYIFMLISYYVSIKKLNGKKFMHYFFSLTVLLSLLLGIIFSFQLPGDIKTFVEKMFYESELVVGPVIFILAGYLLYYFRGDAY